MRPSSRARSIGAYIIALVLGLTIPSLLFSAVMTYQWARSENARLQSLALQINDNVAARVQSFIEAEIGLLEALATSPHLDGGDFHRFHDQARAAIAAGGGVVVLSDPSGQQVANTRVPWGMPLPQAPDATAEKALATKAPQVSDLVMSSEAPTINLAVPVIRRGQAVLALTAVLPASRVGAAVENARVAAPFSASLVDRNGRIVARSIESSAYVGKPHPEFAQAGAPAGQWRGTNPQGLAVEGQYRWLPSGWLVTVGVDRAALRASLMRSAMLVGALGLVLLLIGAVAAGFVIPRVLRAQTALVSAASAIAKGSVVEVPRTGIREADEVGAALSSASRRLNEQASALLSANRDLEARIQERTAELERQTLLLRENEALYRLLAENTTDIIVRNRLDRTREYVSPASRHVLGYEPEELVGQTMTSIVHADDRETIDSEFRAVALGEKKRGSAIYRVRHKSGHWVCIEASFRLATSEQRNAPRCVGAAGPSGPAAG
jgi:PAS domain S-box-containing protein